MSDLPPEAVTTLEQAESILHDLGGRSCDCDWAEETSQTDNPCDVCQVRQAMNLIRKVLTPPLEGLHPGRMRNLPERIYVELFRQQCKRESGINGGLGLLEIVLAPEGFRYVEVSRRDAAVATTMIQWLGTNCGRCFVETAERQIEKENALRRDWAGLGYMMGTPECCKEEQDKGELFRAARQIATTHISGDTHPSSVHELTSQIIKLALEAAKRERKRLIVNLDREPMEATP